MYLPKPNGKKCEICGNPLTGAQIRFCSKDCYITAQNGGKKIHETRYSRLCHDCKKPTNDYRCPGCLNIWRQKHKVKSQALKESYDPTVSLASLD